MSYAQKSWCYHLGMHDRLQKRHPLDIENPEDYSRKDQKKGDPDPFDVPKSEIKDFYYDLLEECLRHVDRVKEEWDTENRKCAHGKN
jgi:hypothetical protein